MELKKAVKKMKDRIKRSKGCMKAIASQKDNFKNDEEYIYFKEDIEAIDTVLNRLEELENRYLELIINGQPFKIKNDVKELQYIDSGNNEFTLEVLEKWN